MQQIVQTCSNHVTGLSSANFWPPTAAIDGHFGYCLGMYNTSFACQTYQWHLWPMRHVCLASCSCQYWVGIGFVTSDPLKAGPPGLKMNPSLIAASLKFSHDHNQKGGSLPQPLGTSQETNHLVHSGKTTWDFKDQVEDQATCTAPTH